MKKKRRLNEKGRRKRRRRIIKRILQLCILLLLIIIICSIGGCVKKLISGKEKDDGKDNVIGKEQTIETSISQQASASLISAGDIIMHGPFLSSNYYLNEDGIYDFNPLFTYIKDSYASADFSIVNLENTISEDNYTSYPLFRGPSAMVTALSNNGVDMCLLANNHIYDNSGDGLTMTQNAMDDNSMLYTGISRLETDDKYIIIDANGIKIGIFNYTYETEKTSEGQRTINTIPVSGENINLINTFNYGELDAFYTEISDGLNAMNSQSVDYTIAYLHWGNEYETTENSKQQEIAQNLCDLGIDALIGGHPHVIQPVDLITSSDGHKMICAYSVGNHLTNQHKGRIDRSPNGHTEDGLMVRLTIDRDKEGIVSLKNAEFIPTWTYRTVGVKDAQNPEYFVFPLDDPEGIVNKAKEISNMDIQSQVSDSLKRTNEIIGDGVKKIKQALPITAIRSTE